MKRMRRHILLSLAGITFVMVSRCGTKVMVPPAIGLSEYGTIGIIEFSSAAEGGLHQFVTQKFLETIQSSQPGVPILELGDEERVLKSVQCDQLDLEAIKAIGKKYNVETLITGRLDVTDVKPKVSLSSWAKLMDVQAVVEASLSARILETGSGATIWTNSAKRKETVANVTIFSSGPVFFNADDPDKAYGKLVQGLVKETTRDFRVRYERKK